jgi:hypothetical protein
MDDIVYHYTSMSGLMGIVQYGKLWCTALGCLNDTKEWSHCFTTAITDANAIIESKVRIVGNCDFDRQQEWLSAFIYHCGRYENFDPVSLNYFVASFSEKGDDLSQWRAYGSGGGVCIGFDRQRIEELKEAQHYRFDRYEYSLDRQSAFIYDAIFSILKSEGDKDHVRFTRSHHGAVTLISSVFAPYFKNSAFEDEAEWRLSIQADTGSAKFRTSRGGGVIIPYLEFDLQLPPKQRVYGFVETPCVITKCIVGPGDHQKLAVSALQNYLWANGINLEVKASAVPWRQSH